MSLENLARVGKLKPHSPTRQEIARLIASARRNLRDACIAGLSAETRFDVALITIALSNERCIVLDKPSLEAWLRINRSELLDRDS